jgi:small-conductance mechanosensitive channel
LKKLRFTLFILLIFVGYKSFAESKCYDVHLNNKSIFCVKLGIGAISAQNRAEAIEAKLEKLAKDYTFDPQTISVIESEGAYSLSVGDLNLVSLREKDLDETNLTLYEYANSIAEKIKLGLDDYRIERSPKTILLGVLYTFIVTLIMILAWVFLRRTQLFLLRKLSALSEKFVEKLKIKSYQLVSPYRIRQIVAGLIRGIRFIISLILLYIYVPLVLSFFTWTAKWVPRIINYVLDPIKYLSSVIIGYVPNLFYIAIILGFTHYAMRFVRLIFNEIELGNLSFSGFHREWAQPTFKLLKVIAYAISLIMIFPYLPGSSSPAFQGLSVFLGVLVSFGSGSAIANMISGIVMTYMRPFRIGDRVKIADTVGDVVEKTFLVTRVKTIKNVDVTIPNAMVLGSHIINYSSSAQEDGLILHTTVTIGYDAPWNKVHELLKNAASKTELIDQEKAPFILQTSLDDFYVSYELNAFTKHASMMAKIYSDLHQNIQDSFNQGGIEIMSPHYSSLRDGNEVAIPTGYRDANDKARGFKLSNNV